MRIRQFPKPLGHLVNALLGQGIGLLTVHFAFFIAQGAEPIFRQNGGFLLMLSTGIILI